MEKSFLFAVRIVELVKKLTKEYHEFILSNQILRSGTSIGATISEGLGGSSKRDFIANEHRNYLLVKSA